MFKLNEVKNNQISLEKSELEKITGGTSTNQVLPGTPLAHELQEKGN